MPSSVYTRIIFEYHIYVEDSIKIASARKVDAYTSSKVILNFAKLLKRKVSNLFQSMIRVK